MEVRVLGPLEVVDGAAVVPLGPKERVVLARLVAARGRAIPEEVLVDAVWGSRPPPTARKTLQGYVHRIRRAMGPDAIVRTAGGYALGDTIEVDIDCVETVISSARAAACQGRLDEAADLFDEALRRFRGEPLREVDDVPTMAGLRGQLAELELSVAEERLVNELERGRNTEVIGALEVLVARDPTRERAWCLLVSALASSGRRADALDAVARAKRALALELGIEPGPRLRELELAVLDDRHAVRPTGGTRQVARAHPRVDRLPETVNLVETSPRAIERSRRPRPVRQRPDLVTMLLLGVVACAQLAGASTFFAWRDTQSYSGGRMLSVAVVAAGATGLLTILYARGGQRAIAFAASVSGCLFGSVLLVSCFVATDDGGTRLLIGVASLGMIGCAGAAVVAVHARPSPTPHRAGEPAVHDGRLVALIQAGTAVVIVAGAIAVNSSSAVPAASQPASTSLPFTTAPPGTATGTTMPASTLPPTPSSEEIFAGRIPTVQGFAVTAASDVAWPSYDLPGGARAYAVEVERNGTPIGQLVVAGRVERNQLFGTYAKRLFNESVPVQGTLDDSSTDALARWEPVNGAAVITAKLPDRDRGQWVWSHGGLIWVVRGQLAAEDYVAAVIAVQQAGSAPLNLQGLSGDLFERLPRFPGIVYYDVPRGKVLEALPTAWSWPCAEAFAMAHVPATDAADPEVLDERSLVIELSSIGRACEQDGFLEELTARLAARPDVRADSIVGRAVYRGDREVVYISGDVVMRISSTSAATMAERRPLIERLIAAQTD